MDSESREKVLIYLKGMSVYGGRARITEQTEIYYDLQLFGDDLRQFAEWLEKKFGIPADLDPEVYGPPEGLLSTLFRRRRWRLARTSRHYKSLRVSDIFGIIDAGRWPDKEK